MTTDAADAHWYQKLLNTEHPDQPGRPMYEIEEDEIEYATPIISCNTKKADAECYCILYKDSDGKEGAEYHHIPWNREWLYPMTTKEEAVAILRRTRRDGYVARLLHSTLGEIPI